MPHQDLDQDQEAMKEEEEEEITLEAAEVADAAVSALQEAEAEITEEMRAEHLAEEEDQKAAAEEATVVTLKAREIKEAIKMVILLSMACPLNSTLNESKRS